MREEAALHRANHARPCHSERALSPSLLSGQAPAKGEGGITEARSGSGGCGRLAARSVKALEPLPRPSERLPSWRPVSADQAEVWPEGR